MTDRNHQHSVHQPSARARRGASALAYGLVLGLISFGALGAVTGIGEELEDLFAQTSDAIGERGPRPSENEPTPIAPLSLAQPLGDQAVNAAPISVRVPAGTFSDAAAILTAALANGDPLPAWLSFDGTTFTGTPPTTDPLSVEITVTATRGAESVSDTFMLAVDLPDPITLLTPLADQTLSSAPINISVPAGTFSDDTASLTATLESGDPLPAWLSFDGGTFTGTPPTTDPITLMIRVTATNSDGNSADDLFTLTVDLPEPVSVAQPIPDQTWTVLAQWDFPVPAATFSEPGATLTADLANGDPLPDWLSFDGSGFTGLPPMDRDNDVVLDLRVIANADGQTVSETFRLTARGPTKGPSQVFLNADTFVCDNTQSDVTTACLLSWPIPQTNVVGVEVIFEVNPSKASSCQVGRFDYSVLFEQPATRLIGGTYAESYNGRGNFSFNGVFNNSSFKLCAPGVSKSGGQCVDQMPDNNTTKYMTYTYSLADFRATHANASAPTTRLDFDVVYNPTGGNDFPALGTNDAITFRNAVPHSTSCGLTTTQSDGQNGAIRIVSIDLTTN